MWPLIGQFALRNVLNWIETFYVYIPVSLFLSPLGSSKKKHVDQSSLFNSFIKIKKYKCIKINCRKSQHNSLHGGCEPSINTL